MTRYPNDAEIFDLADWFPIGSKFEGAKIYGAQIERGGAGTLQLFACREYDRKSRKSTTARVQRRGVPERDRARNVGARDLA